MRAAALLTLFLLWGCAEPRLYAWGPYQAVTAGALQGKGRNPQAEILRMEQSARQAMMHGETLPPGWHAQLGMLYAGTGNRDRMEAEYLLEKQLYPASGTFMDFLLNEGDGDGR